MTLDVDRDSADAAQDTLVTPLALRADPPGVPAARAVPPGRIRYDLSADVLLLHSLVSPDAYATLAYYGRLRADPAHVDPYFVPAYDWMRDQMAKRVPGHTGDYPIWLWAKIRRDDLVSSVRLAARHQPGTVLVTCRIARQRCLLSNFSDWHLVLNASPPDDWDGPAPREGPDLDHYDQRLEQAYAKSDTRLRRAGIPLDSPISAWPQDLRTEHHRGWERILDPANYRPSESWQACVDELVAADIVYAVRPM